MRSNWIKIEGAERLSPGRGQAFDVEGLQLAIFNDGGSFFALDDRCPHQGASLATGMVHAGRVVCPLHSWVFDLASGRCPRESHDPVSSYTARCRDGAVEVEIPWTQGPA
jgi:nitrite reductase/ring-hydroxylating ferredoxin subunit